MAKKMKYVTAFIVILICSLVQSIDFGGSDQHCDFEPENAAFEISPDIVDYTLNAAILSEFSYRRNLYKNIRKHNYTYGFQLLKVWKDWDDLALLAREDGVCYAAFRGTIGINPTDVFQLYACPEKMVSGCKVRGGFFNAYFARYYDKFRAAVDECMQSANELVVTGQSQGGSNAIVAFLDLQQYNPIAITFGALRTLVEPCHSIDTSRHYRFVSVGGGFFDEWTNRFRHSAMHMGHCLLLDAAATAPAAYMGLDDNESRNPQSMQVHDPDLYWSGLYSMISSACNQRIRISGWEDGHWCVSNEECDSGSCVDRICYREDEVLR